MWDYDKDEVTIVYDPKVTTPQALAKVIGGLGYKVEAVVPSKPDKDRGKGKTLKKAPMPKDAPKFFIKAMERARKLRRPVVIDFWAEWCAPCKALKEKTLKQVDVAAALKSVELIFVDLDKHPELAKDYGVKSIPDVFFIDPDGNVVDRLRKFETADPFLKRLKIFRAEPKKRGGK